MRYIIIILLFSSCVDLSGPSKEANKWIGKKIVIDKDTLTVMEYSAISERLYLSNGSDVTYEFAKKYFTQQK